MRDVFVIGVGMTKIKAYWEKSLRNLFAEASIKAIEDANGISPDAIFIGNMAAGELDKQANLGVYLAEYAGLKEIPAIRVESACGSGGAAFHAAYLGVASGMYNAILVGGVEKLTETPSMITTSVLAEAADQEYETYFGASFTALNALIMRYYMSVFKVPYEKIALWPLMMHENATYNPLAQLPFKVDLNTILNSPLIADPIRLFDCAPTGDGAAAVIIASEEIAKKHSDTPIFVPGIGFATDSLALSRRENLLSLKGTNLAAKKAYSMAKVNPNDINIAEIHDAFSILGIITLEDLGFSTKGEGTKDLENGKFSRNSVISVNPSGGLKARGHPVGATGIYQIAEIALQLRQDAGKMQIDNAELGLAHNIGGVGASVSVTILRR